MAATELKYEKLLSLLESDLLLEDNIAPVKIELAPDAGWRQIIIGIGNDHTAYILIDSDSLAALKILAGANP